MISEKCKFIITQYFYLEDGSLFPEIPSVGLCYKQDNRPCCIKRHTKRKRLTGPKHPLVLIYCKTHDRYFTLYPPGHYPYGRQAIYAVAPDGSPILINDEENQRPPPNINFKDTCFEASFDASEGKPWNRTCENFTDNWWETQRRKIGKTMKLTGVSPDLKERTREKISEILEIDGLDLFKEKQTILHHPGYRSRGCAVTSILEKLFCRNGVLERLMLSGYLAGLWGRPYWWDSKTKVIRTSPFQLTRIDIPP